MNLQAMLGFGVAGNFTGHLEQAGESSDFVGVITDEENAPKGLFPFYLPCHPNSHLATFPLSPIVIKQPDGSANLQMEPEVALICDILYDQERISSILPKFFAAYNDCSIRREGAKKISDKKHWGASSKGISPNFIQIDSFSIGGVLDRYNIASFVKRAGIMHEYGIDSKVNSYSYFYDKLLKWVTHKLNTQTDFGPLENLHKHILECNFPSEVIISIGATKYTEFGENSYLETGDEVFVVLYPTDIYSKEQIIFKLKNGSYQSPDISTLHQVVL